jgi:NMD protein affecting ribosome stability and mRNA decay
VEKFCPICGRSSKEVEFVGEFCKDCYLERAKQKLPTSAEIKKCRKCGKIKVSGEWVEESKENLEKAISKNIGFKFELKELRNDIASGFIYIDDSKVEAKIKIKFIRTLCLEDLLKSAKYYEAKVQLRGNEEEVKKIEKEIERNLRNTYILQKIKDKNGVDLLIGNRKELEKVIRALELKPKVTFSLVGMRNGKRVYRATYLIRCEDDKAQDNNH